MSQYTNYFFSLAMSLANLAVAICQAIRGKRNIQTSDRHRTSTYEGKATTDEKAHLMEQE